MRITLTVIPPALVAIVVTLLVMRNTAAPQTPLTPGPTPTTAARDLATPTPAATPTPSPSPPHSPARSIPHRHA